MAANQFVAENWQEELGLVTIQQALALPWPEHTLTPPGSLVHQLYLWSSKLATPFCLFKVLSSLPLRVIFSP